ncbi:hypothetical protein EVAR_82365_1 [Eumeta japonica]|uniref:Uncharacterized protein n=1 Tax=Eumeta variegata TaxID=151549 RepID=A0A4C1UAT0_EUMVA|nr:hypothetical protein EVAR_82365_1 [Eumeta japonica]
MKRHASMRPFSIASYAVVSICRSKIPIRMYASGGVRADANNAPQISGDEPPDAGKWMANDARKSDRPAGRQSGACPHKSSVSENRAM